MTGKITTVLAKKEAEAYRAQGLHREAVQLFTELLSSSPHMNPDIRAALEKQIHGIRSEMTDVDRQRQRSLTPQEIVRIREGWGEKATESDLLVCAQAFSQMGAHAEALTELQNILARGHLKKIYLWAAAENFVQLYSPDQLASAIEQWTRATGQPLKAILAMQLAMARHMEDRLNFTHAQVLYRHLQRIPALAAGMKRRIGDLTTRRQP